MAKKPRKIRNKEQLQEIEEVPVETPAAPRNITHVLRCRCPLCGMLPEFERIMGGPYPLEAKDQQFGGDRYMKYDTVEDQETLDNYRTTLSRKIQQVIEMLEEQ